MGRPASWQRGKPRCASGRSCAAASPGGCHRVPRGLASTLQQTAGRICLPGRNWCLVGARTSAPLPGLNRRTSRSRARIRSRTKSRPSHCRFCRSLSIGPALVGERDCRQCLERANLAVGGAQIAFAISLGRLDDGRVRAHVFERHVLRHAVGPGRGQGGGASRGAARSLDPPAVGYCVRVQKVELTTAGCWNPQHSLTGRGS